MVDCLQLEQDLLSLETRHQIEKWISIPSKVVLVTSREKEIPYVHMQGVNKPNSGILMVVFTLEQWWIIHLDMKTGRCLTWKDNRRVIHIEYTSDG